MKKLKLSLALLLASCHAVPTSASDLKVKNVDYHFRSDAEKVCSMGKVVTKKEECVSIVANEYLDAAMEGALEPRSFVSYYKAVELAYKVTDCKPQLSAICKEHVTNWASWYVYGSRKALKSKTIRNDAKQYFKGTPLPDDPGYDDNPIPREDLKEYLDDEPYESQYLYPGDVED